MNRPLLLLPLLALALPPLAQDPATQSPTAEKTHAESAVPESHAESAEPEPHAETSLPDESDPPAPSDRIYSPYGELCTPYVIAPGDTLSRISAATGVPMETIVRMNRLQDPNRIRAGDKLYLPYRIVTPEGMLVPPWPRTTNAPAATPAGPPPAAPAPAAPPASRSNACDRLSLAILADAAAARRNVVFSPFSLSGALGMAALGAKGDTLAQIDRVAGTGADPEALANREARARAAILEAARADGIELVLADSLWKRKGDAPLPAFAERVRRGFGGEVLDFGPFPASAVNRWVSRKTKGLLPSAFDDLPSGTRLALVDAIYFKARWAVPFERKRTSDRTFYPEGGAPRTVPFMNLLAFFAYDSSDRWESLEIPYRGERFRMQIVLPRPGVTVADLVGDWISGADAPPDIADDGEARPWTAYLELSLPKFSLGSSPDVGDALRRLGATDAFDPARADFSGMFPPSAEPFYLTGFSHCAAIEVDERGTTAAAASGISFGCRAPTPPDRLVVDRPFVFLVRGPDGRILFAGALFDAAP